MASKLVKLSTNGRRKIVTQFKTPLVNSKPLTFRPQKNLGKRKRSNEIKQCCSYSRNTSVKNYNNFIKSGPPQRLLYYSQDGQWVDFEKEIVDLVKPDFISKKAAIEVKVNGFHLMLQILYMVSMDLKTGQEKPIAWIDDGGKCVFPEIHATCHGNHDDVDLAESSSLPQEIKLHLEIDLNGINNYQECMGESNVKRVKLDEEGQCQNDENAPDQEYASPMREVICGNVDVESARRMFVDEDLKAEILEVKKCSGSFLEAREKLFQAQVEITQKTRGKANVVYAWCVANGDATAGVLFHAHNGPKLGMYGYGVHLAPLNSAHKSAMKCDVDEKGVKHMVLCRVILGNQETLQIGCKQFHASNYTFDTGVDNPQNPNHYIIWNMNINTHIFPECTISFKTPPLPQGTPVVEESGVGISRVTDQNTPVMPHQQKDPKSPWMPFSMLFEAVSDKVTPDNMNLVHILYNSFRAREMVREDFIKKLRDVVGDQILRSTISSLQSKHGSNSGGSVTDAKEG